MDAILFAENHHMHIDTSIFVIRDNEIPFRAVFSVDLDVSTLL